jgi:micrococcal nuclease
MPLHLSIAATLFLAVQTGERVVDLRVRTGQRGDNVLVAEEVFKASVRDVVDGDSVVVQDNGKTTVLRLDGVDAPELSQAFGNDARDFLRNLLIGKVVIVRRLSRLHPNGESLARVEVDDADVSAALISRGLAWHCGRYAENRELAVAEKVAKDGKQGLWRDATPTPPWVFRGVTSCWQDAKRR